MRIWCDGSAMPNPGPAGAGYVVVGDVHLLGSESLGHATSNTAEYTAVLNALRAAADQGAKRAYVRMDSLVVFKQLTRKTQCKAEHLVTLRARVWEQKARYSEGVTFRWIPRKENGVADALANAGAIASKKGMSSFAHGLD